MGEPRTAGTRARLIARYQSVKLRGDPEDVGRQQVIEASFERNLSAHLPPAGKVLDAGCGEGWFSLWALRRGLDVESFDLSPENVAFCQRRGLPSVRVADITAWDGQPGPVRYDAIVLLDVVEHLPKDQAAPVLDACRQRLAPGGVLLVQTCNLGSLYGVANLFNDLTHEFGVAETSAADLMEAAGFLRDRVDVLPVWEAATPLGRVREWWVRVVHLAFSVGWGAGRFRIPTKNLLIVARP